MATKHFPKGLDGRMRDQNGVLSAVHFWLRCLFSPPFFTRFSPSLAFNRTSL